MSDQPRPAVAWVDLTAPDPGRASRFYAQLFGWTLSSEATDMGTYTIGSVADGPAAGMMAPSPEEVGAPPAWTVMFAVDDIDDAYQRGLAAGATGLQPPMAIPGGDRIAVLADPAGAVFGLMRTAGPPLVWGALGAVCWVETASRDRDGSRQFYEELFGWSASEGEGGYWLFERDGEEVAGLMDVPPGVPDEVPSYWLVYFAVDDVDTAVARASELGGSVAAPAMEVGDMRFAVLEDTEGAVFAVLQGAG